MSDKTELEVVATFDGLYLIPRIMLEGGTELCRLAAAERLLAERDAEIERAKEGWLRVNDRALKAELERNQLRAQLAAAQETVAWQARFTDPGQKWGDCTKEHYDLVKANPGEWPGYEVRELYAAPQLTAD